MNRFEAIFQIRTPNGWADYVRQTVHSFNAAKSEAQRLAWENATEFRVRVEHWNDVGEPRQPNRFAGDWRREDMSIADQQTAEIDRCRFRKNALPYYVDKTEARIARRLVTGALALGYEIQVYDGEELACDWTSNRGEILGAMASTDSDVLRFRMPYNVDTTRHAVWLIWGNGEDLVSDSTELPSELERLCYE